MNRWGNLQNNLGTLDVTHFQAMWYFVWLWFVQSRLLCLKVNECKLRRRKEMYWEVLYVKSKDTTKMLTCFRRYICIWNILLELSSRRGLKQVKEIYSKRKKNTNTPTFFLIETIQKMKYSGSLNQFEYIINNVLNIPSRNNHRFRLLKQTMWKIKV